MLYFIYILVSLWYFQICLLVFNFSFLFLIFIFAWWGREILIFQSIITVSFIWLYLSHVFPLCPFCVLGTSGKQEVVGLNPARAASEVFSTDTRYTLSIQCYTHVGVGQNYINSFSGTYLYIKILLLTSVMSQMFLILWNTVHSRKENSVFPMGTAGMTDISRIHTH